MVVMTIILINEKIVRIVMMMMIKNTSNNANRSKTDT